MKKNIIFIVIICLFNLSACSQNENMQETNIDKVTFECDKYSGTWTSYGYNENDIYTKAGGGILSINIVENHLEGTYTYVQDKSYRIASVEDFEAEIIDSVAEFDFLDDGWGNSGKITLTFKEDVNVIIDDVRESSENVTGMMISSALLKKENSVESNIDEKENEKSIEQQIMETASYREQSKYWQEVVEWDEANLWTGMDRPLEALLSSDRKNYSIEELQKYPEVILYLGLNEIYARHGYIFTDEDLNNYFMGQIWYKSCLESEFFDEEVLNDYERKNRSILLKLLGRK